MVNWSLGCLGYGGIPQSVPFPELDARNDMDLILLYLVLHGKYFKVASLLIEHSVYVGSRGEEHCTAPNNGIEIPLRPPKHGAALYALDTLARHR